MRTSTIDDRDITINQNKRHAPAGAGRALAAVVLALAGLLALWLLITTLDPQARAAREVAQWRSQQLDSDLYTVDMVAGALLRLALPITLAVGALGVVVVGLRLVYIRWASVMAVKAHYSVKMVEAQQQLVPHTLTYSPHYAYRSLEGHTPAALGSALALAAAHSPVPTFAELLDRGTVGRGNPLLLGVDVESGEQLTGSWLDLYSTAIGGLPGTGKTTSQRFLACQTALHGAGFVIVDPHAGAGEDSLAETLAPLSAAFLCEPASDDKGMLQAVRLVADIGARRVKGDRDRRPIVLWLDETTALLSRSSVGDQLATLLEQIAQEYRKVAIFAAASGQIWTASRTGDDSALRDSFASVWAHRMKRSQARLLLPTGEAERVERLDKGQALIWRTSGATNIISVPNTTASDVVRVATLLADARHTQTPKGSQFVAVGTPDDMPVGSQKVAKGEVATGASQSASTASAEARRAAALFRAGKDPAAIVNELRGVSSSQGKKYQLALSEVLNLIRQGLE